MSKRLFILGMMAHLVTVPAMAQESVSDRLEAIRQAMRLPTVTQEARVLGVPERDLQSVFATAREQRLPAGYLAEVLAVENEAIRKHGPIDNFGAFVQERLKAGLRGRELADAIHAEHTARGMGHGRSAAVGKPDVHHGQSGAGGKPGSSGDHGNKPEAPGKSGESGKKGDS